MVVDAFHAWWDQEIMPQIERAGEESSASTCLTSRRLCPRSSWAGPWGDGVIKLRKLRQALDTSDHDGPIEVEIFNDEIWKSADAGLLELILRRFIERVLGKQHGR